MGILYHMLKCPNTKKPRLGLIYGISVAEDILYDARLILKYGSP